VILPRPYNQQRVLSFVRLRTLVSTAILILSIGCEDVLPVYQVPGEIFAASYIRNEVDTLQFSEPRDGSGGAIATYLPYYVTFSVTNTYEETFQYDIAPKGTMEIWVPNSRTASSTNIFSDAEIQSTPAYNASTNILTLNPGASIYFKVRIDPKLASGFYLHKYASELSSTVYSSAYYIERIYNPLTVTARFSVQLAPDLPAVTTETPITVQLKGRFPFSP
jgi:hypothetical protein